MIKKFEEFINEGLWKSGIERSESDTIRKEDESDVLKWLKSNPSIKEIDLGLPSGNKWLNLTYGNMTDDVYGEGKYLSAKEIIDLNNNLPIGYKLVTYEDWKELCKNCDSKWTKPNRKTKVHYVSIDNGKLVIPDNGIDFMGEINKQVFPSYYIVYPESDDSVICHICSSFFSDFNNSRKRIREYDDTVKFNIRLIKTK